MDFQEKDGNGNSDSSEFLSGYLDINSFTQTLLKATLKGIKLSNKIPASGEKFNFFHSFPGFRQLMQTERKQILDLMIKILQNQGVRGTFEKVEIEEKFDFLVDTNDSLLERAGNALDDASGIKRKEEAVLTTIKYVKPINTSWNKKMSPRSASVSLLAAKNVERPQMKFAKKIDNSNSPFMPSINYKPHSIKPLSILLESSEDGHQVFCHPYEIEIEKFQPSDDNLQTVIPQIPENIETTPLDYITTLPNLIKLCRNLAEECELAVDLEAHSYRTFQGFTCLMQISTRSRDILIDVLELRDHMHLLNEIFTNPKVVKVFHGADMDVVWLQRDFGVYLVNLFDTGQAARVLNYSHFSLAYLLKRFCQVDPDKSFQLADWRIRPLSEKMIHYAREDTHHLLYVYDCLRNELLDQGNEQNNLLLSVYQRSKHICLKRYEKMLLSEDSYLSLYHKSKKIFNTRQLFSLKELYMWRDKMARTEDESYGYVLPNHMMLQIAEILPREQQGILACCNPIPPLVRQQLNELHILILNAREWSEDKLLVPQSHLKLSASQLRRQIHQETSQSCPHDLRPQDENSFPTFLDVGDTMAGFLNPTIEKKTPDLLAFLPICLQEDKRLSNVNLLLCQVISPFQRFQLVEKTLIAVEKPVAFANEEKEIGINWKHIERVHTHFQSLITSNVEHMTDSSDLEKTKRNLTETGLEQPEDSTPLCDQVPRKRKRKSQRPVTDMPFTPKEENPVAKEFTAYAYTSSESSTHPSDPRRYKTSKKRHFDPTGNSFQSKKGTFPKKSRAGKNVTYGSKPRDLQRNPWPN